MLHETTFELKIVDHTQTFKLSIEPFSWSLYTDDGVCIFNGHYNYNDTDTVMCIEDKRYYFFQESFRKKINAFARKNNFIR